MKEWGAYEPEYTTDIRVSQNMPAYQKLEQLAEALKAQHLNDLFKNEPDRFNDYSIHIEQLTFDYSKHRVNQDVIGQLVALAEQQKLPEWIHALFSEQEINYTEQRAAMHSLAVA